MVNRFSHPLPRPGQAAYNTPDPPQPQSEPAMIPQAPETRIVNTWRVACDGGEGGLGHPRVWLQIPRDTGAVECGYCDCKYVHQSFADTPTAG